MSAPHDTPGASRGTIVIAEDDPATLLILSTMLRKERFTVIGVENGKLAWDAVRREHPDVVLLDWLMPVMDGVEAANALKADPQTRGIPIVMLTTLAEIDERVAALDGGVQDYLTKPVDARELIARIEQQLRWRKTLALDAHAAFAKERLPQYNGSDVNSQTDSGSAVNGLSFLSAPGLQQKKRHSNW